MYTSLVAYTILPGKKDTFLALLQDETFLALVTPRLEEIPGFIGEYILARHDTAEVVGLVLYETEADARLAQAGGKALEALAMVAGDLLAPSSSEESYDIIAQI